jgi:hypothetical protein
VQLIDVPVAIAIEIDVGGNIEGHHEGLFLVFELKGRGNFTGLFDHGRHDHFRGKIDLVALKIVIAVDENRGVKRRNNPGEVTLGEVGKIQVLGSFEVDPVIAEFGAGIENDNTLLLAHFQKGIEVDEPFGPVLGRVNELSVHLGINERYAHRWKNDYY